MAEQRIPSPDADFGAAMTHFYDGAKAFWESHGLDTNELIPLESALLAWRAAFPACTAAQAQARAAKAAKDAARAGRWSRRPAPSPRTCRRLPFTTDADRAAMGISIRPPRGTRSTAPASAPRVLVSAASRLTHELRLVDESTPTRRARPRGAHRAEVYVAMTGPHAPAPSDLDAFRYIGSTSDGTTTLTFPQAQGGQQAHYLARWVSPRNASGPWSETASATVAA